MGDDTYEKGLALRKRVLGAEFVDKALNSADDFNRPIQTLATAYCWGAVWAREGLSPRDRSLLNIGMIAALNRPHEFKLHIKGALNNGLSRDEIREAILQVAVYCGMPAGMDATRIAREAFAEVDAAAEGR
jgi:4-carboxymuconolactone decarboxylase